MNQDKERLFVLFIAVVVIISVAVGFIEFCYLITK